MTKIEPILHNSYINQKRSTIKIAFLFSGPIAIMNKCVRTVSVKESAPDSIR